MFEQENPRGPLRSSIMTEGVDRATHRSLFYSMGWHPGHLKKPLVAVVNSFNVWGDATVSGTPRAADSRRGVHGFVDVGKSSGE